MDICLDSQRLKTLFKLLLASLPLYACTSQPGRAPAVDDRQQWLAAHNTVRVRHGMAPLVWSEDLAASAQAVADSCPSGHSDTHYGENLAWVSSNRSPLFIVKLWYEEEPSYDYAKPGFSAKTGHFTQIVWKSTRELGCGQKNGCNTRIPNVWVCHYDPPGNYSGQFADNVGRPNGY